MRLRAAGRATARASFSANRIPTGIATGSVCPTARRSSAPAELTAVGFFGRPRADVDQLPIHDLEAGIVDTLETISGVLCYYDLALAEGGYGNLILCAAPDSPTHVHAHPLHRRAVELTPRHYHCVRLHTGVVPGRFMGDAGLVLERTRYYDFDSDPPWLAVRNLV